MSKMRALKFVGVGLTLAYLLPTACGSGGVVGGECKRDNCQNGTGADGAGMRPGSGAANSGGSDGEAGEGRGGFGTSGNGQLPDGGFFDSPVDGQSDAEAPLECLPPHNVPSHCGDCDTQCREPNPLCELRDGSYVCVPECDPPLVECQGRCMVDPDDFLSDPQHCGECGNDCPSDICQNGQCVGARYGNVALICSDFNSATSNSSPTTLLGNAVFMPATNPVHVLAYTRGAAAAAVNRVNQVITWAGDARGREAEITSATSVSAVTSNLNVDDYQVLLIHDLDQATSGDPAAAAAAWDNASVLSSFTRAGGVILVLDGGDGTAEMHELISGGNLLAINGQTELATGDFVWNQAPFDVLGSNVLSPFLGTSHTCTFDTNVASDNETIFVLTDDEEGGAPVAIHRVIAP
jgi:hypothetical protein